MTDIIKNSNSISYTFTLHPIKNITEEKDLGVIVDEDLNFKNHISSKISKANSMIYLIKNCFKYLDTEMFKTLYKTLIRPHLEYASPVSQWEFSIGDRDISVCSCDFCRKS